MTTTARRRLATAALFALPTALLSACGGGGDSKTGGAASASAGPSISMKTALASDDAATTACKTLLGDGTELAKDLRWPTTDAKQLTVNGQVSGDVKGVIVCGLSSAGGDNSAYVRIANTADGARSEASTVAGNDSSTKSHATSMNKDNTMGAAIGEIPTETVTAVQTTLDALMTRVQQ